MPRTNTRRPQGAQDQGGTSRALTTTEAETQALTQVARYVAAKRDQLAMLLGPQVDPERFITVALSAVQGQPKLLQCTPLSIFTAIREAATWGLELGPLGDASLTPYQDEATLSVEYRGYRKLAMRDGTVRVIAADVVYTNDRFRIVSGSEDPRIEHEPALTDRGNVLGAYAWARLANGELLHVWMTEAQLYQRRDVSRSWQTALKYGRTDSIWHLWPIEMMRKTVIKRLCSEQLPLTPLLREVLDRDTQADLLTPGDRKPVAPAGQLQAGDARARILASMGLDQPAPAQLPAGDTMPNTPPGGGDQDGDGAPDDDQVDDEEAAAAAWAAAQAQQPAADDSAPTQPVASQPVSQAESGTIVGCDDPNPYDQQGQPCALPAGHKGNHKNKAKESW